MELEQSGVNVGEVATTQEENVQNVQSENVDVQETSVSSEVADPKPVQDAETNARFAEQRRKQELDEVRKQAEQHQRDLQRVANMAGYNSHEEFLRAVEQREEEMRIQREAQNMGMDEETYRQYLMPVNQKLQQYEQKIQQLETADLSRQVSQELAELKKDADFGQYEQATIDLWKSNPAFSTLKDAYDFVSYKDKLQKVAQATEQETIRKLQQNQTTSTGSLGIGDSAHKTSISSMGKEDFSSLVDKVLRGELKQL